MPRLVYLVELDPVSIAQLQATGTVIQDILDNIQIVQIEEDSPQVTRGEDGTQFVTLEPAGENNEAVSERTVDPMFNPPPAAPPMNPQTDFGAGPPPRGGLG